MQAVEIEAPDQAGGAIVVVAGEGDAVEGDDVVVPEADATELRVHVEGEQQPGADVAHGVGVDRAAEPV